MQQNLQTMPAEWLRILFKGAGQVMFQGSWATGLLFMTGIFWGAWAEGRIALAWAALVGLVVATCTGRLMGFPHREGSEGLWGFNGVLVGCGLMSFLEPTPAAWALVVLGAAMTVWLRDGMNRLMAPWHINSLTMPFVLVVWLLLAAARGLHALPPEGLSEPAFPQAATLPHPDLRLFPLLAAWLRGIGQIFLLNSWFAGLLFLVGLWLSSRRAALWAMTGSAIALLVALALGASGRALNEGLYGFSASLTAIALGSAFHQPSWRVTLWSVTGVVVTLLVQVAVDQLLSPVGLPSLTFPFCLTTWLFLLPRLRLDKGAIPDHSHWHKRGE